MKHPKHCIKRFILGTLLYISSACDIHAQSTVQGVVVSETGEPLSRISVALLHATDSVLVKAVLSDTTGAYQFSNIPKGIYLLNFTYTGFKQLYSLPYSITGDGQTTIAGVTKLPKESMQLSNVTVTAKKPLFEQKIDRLIINVRNSVTSAGGTALQVLERSPGVVVDRQNNALSMNGKDGVLVMINGKENRIPVSALLQMLAGMNAGNIEKIELIAAPPANYNAEGNAGIINIVMVENNNDGINGTVTGSIGVGKSKITSSGLNFNYRKGKTNFYGDYSFSATDMYQLFLRHRQNDFAGHTKSLERRNDRYPDTKNFSGRTGVDIQLSQKTTFGAVVSGYINNWEMDMDTKTDYFTDQQLDTMVRMKVDERDYWKSYTANLNVYHIFRQEENISVNLDYLYFRARNPVDYITSFFNGTDDFLFEEEMRTRKLTPITFWIGSVDYNRKLGKNIQMQAGVKLTSSGFKNDVLVQKLSQNDWVTDPGFSANYELNEEVRAAYILISSPIGSKLTLKAGLRYENTQSVLLNTGNHQKVVDRRYGKLFPSLFLNRKIDDNSSVNFYYSRRITRPTFNVLAPFTVFTDPYTLVTGNPALQPSIADVITAGYSYKKYIVSLSYTYEADAIARFQNIVDPATNIEMVSPENLENLRTIALILSAPVTPTKWWTMQYNVSAKWQQSNSFYKTLPIVIQQKNWRITGLQSFKLPKSFVVEISGSYQSADLSGRVIRKSFGSLDLGLQKKIGDKGKIAITAIDILNTMRSRTYQDISEQHFSTRTNFQFTQRMIKLTYTQGFGNNKLKEKRRRADNAEEERKRVE